MGKILKKLSRNKIFFVFVFLIIFMFPSTLYLQSDKDKTMIVTTLGIDKKDDKLTLSALAVIPNSSQEISAKLEVFEGEGESVDEALANISQNAGKEIGLAHCDCLLVSKDISTQNLTRYLDFFIRSSNLTTYATIIVSDGPAKDLLEATKASNDYLDLSLKNIVTFEEQRSLLENVNIEEFYRRYFSIGSTYTLPILSTEEGESNAKSSGENKEGGNASENKKIINDNKMAVFKKGEFVRELSEDENFIYNLISPTSNYGTIKVENINDNFVTESTEIFKQKKKFILPIFKFVNNTPTVDYNIFLSIEINEVIGEDFSYASIDSLQTFQSKTVKEKINKQVQDKLNITEKLMKQDKLDILDLYTKFNAFKTSNWKEYLKTLKSPSDYLNGIDININLHLINI